MQGVVILSITVAKYGVKDGKEVCAYTLSCGSLTAEIINYGGIITKLIYKGVDVVLGRDSLEEYLNNRGHFGALVGRNSNRIAGAQFELGGKTYKLRANNGKNNLHGGIEGFGKKVWSAQAVDGDEPSLELTLTSPDGDEGFPGEVNVKVTYTVTKDNALKIHYEGVSDADTVLNLTNHTYFNLNGHDSGTVDGHRLYMPSEFFTPNCDECMPTGEILSVKGTPFDFSTDETLGERFVSDYEQIKMFDGFDHNIVLSGDISKVSARLTGDKSGIEMEMYTDCIGVQLYTGNSIEQGRVCKGGAVYGKHGALCLETQAFPNNLKYPHFPSAILRKGEKYDTVTVYKFK